MLVRINYLLILGLLFLGLGIGLLLALLNFFFAPKLRDNEKLSAYECGFLPFEDARVKFQVHFYLIGILFIIFDLEIAYLFPWAMNLGCLDKQTFYSMIFFLLVLTIGFIYEFFKGALGWSLTALD